jgi:hypothetical protein
MILNAGGEPGVQVGTTRLFSGATTLCNFDLWCLGEQDNGSHVIEATLQDGKGGCIGGYYRFAETDADNFHLNFSQEESGVPVQAYGDFSRVD